MATVDEPGTKRPVRAVKREFYSIPEVAVMLGLSRKTVAEMARDGHFGKTTTFPCGRRTGTSERISVKGYEEFVKSRTF